MRATIILTICFIGVVFAESLSKRSSIDDSQTKQDAEKSLGEISSFFEQFKPKSSESTDVFTVAVQNAKEAIRKLLPFFQQKPQSYQSSEAFTTARHNCENTVWNLISLSGQFQPQSYASPNAFYAAKFKFDDATWKLLSICGQF
ncbi:uncharacterized protein LOC107372064 [Tetranychus urticae]|uniref:uncharacterized protein LOC107372061 n=1 Tax=Tetranychus urticae TaxID=32264 RepID=UPI00077BEF08|nr:uncharacterized protein LOC107372061 [Tetranychus urticae]XP_015795694.1 uncharacterized protein LOC107372064 [Tetranychus urticae]